MQIRQIFIYHLLCGIFVAPHYSRAQTNSHSPFERKYNKGQNYRYKLTTSEWNNGQWVRTSESICSIRVVLDSAGIPNDEIKWLSKKTLTPKDSLNQSKEAEEVKPYLISLDPKGKLLLPKIEQPAMTASIADFNTFWVAISPAVQVWKVRHPGDSVLIATPVTGDFSNGKTILRGEDYLQISVRVTGETPGKVFLTTSFMPPVKGGMHYLLPEMNNPVVKDTFNNFQMVMPAGNGTVHVQYGREYFYINSAVDKSDGKLLEASMYNELNLRLKLNCDSTYSRCKTEIPFHIERKLQLELIE